MIDKEKIFPCLLILLQIISAVMYAWKKEYKQALYWLFAAALNITVTF